MWTPSGCTRQCFAKMINLAQPLHTPHHGCKLWTSCMITSMSHVLSGPLIDCMPQAFAWLETCSRTHYFSAAHALALLSVTASVLCQVQDPVQPCLPVSEFALQPKQHVLIAVCRLMNQGSSSRIPWVECKSCLTMAGFLAGWSLADSCYRCLPLLQ